MRLFPKRNEMTEEEAARLGARDNLLLGAAQLFVGLTTGNFGFKVEAGHQAADAAALKAKADAMHEGCSPVRARRLRKAAAVVLLTGGGLGIFGGLKHIHEGETEDASDLAVAAAVAGAAVNTVVARRSHGAHHAHGHDEADDHESDDHDHHADEAESDHHDHHAHQHGAGIDTLVHTLTDMGTGIAYASALVAERRFPGVSNYVLIMNGVVVGSAGAHTMARIVADDKNTHAH